MDKQTIDINLQVQVIYYEKEMELGNIFIYKKERITTEMAENILNEKEIPFDTVLKIAREKITYSLTFQDLQKFDFVFKK